MTGKLIDLEAILVRRAAEQMVGPKGTIGMNGPRTLPTDIAPRSKEEQKGYGQKLPVWRREICLACDKPAVGLTSYCGLHGDRVARGVPVDVHLYHLTQVEQKRLWQKGKRFGGKIRLPGSPPERKSA